MKKRLLLAKELLKDDGVIFISIDDNEQAYLKILMDEIFGEDNFIANLIFNKKNAQNDNKTVEKNHEYILMYCKRNDLFSINTRLIKNENKGKTYSLTIGATGGGLLINRKNLGWTLYYNPETNDKIPKFDYDPEKVTEFSTIIDIYNDDKELINKGYIPIRPPYKNNRIQRWTWDIKRAIENKDKIIPKKTKSNEWTLHYMDERDEKHIPHKSIIDNLSSAQGSNELNNIGIQFSNPKSVDLIKMLIDKHSNKNATVLDFFAGSGTTAQAVMELNQEDNGNRRFIVITNNENNIASTNNENNIATDICRERIYRVINGKGSNNEPIKWAYSDEIKSLTNNHVKYLRVEPINKYDGEFEDINNMKPLYKNEFNIDDLNIKDFER